VTTGKNKRKGRGFSPGLFCWWGANISKEMDAGKLIINDECGATPLIRALQEYKCCQLNYSHQYRQKRGEILFQWNNKQEKINSHLCGNSAIGETMGEKRCELGERTLLELTETANEYAQAMSTDKNQQQALKQRSKFLKEKVIIPLIEKVPADTLLDEATQVDTSSCVSALQLAIDSFDADFVECILGRLSDNPLTFYISDEYTTPLQYAIRKYDFWQLLQEGDGAGRWCQSLQAEAAKINDNKKACGNAVFFCC